MKFAVIILGMLCFALHCFAQKQSEKSSVISTYDSSYYQSFFMDIVGRYYFSQKFTTIRLSGIDNKNKLKYLPNTTLNMGVGITYKPLTINLGYGFEFLNNNADKGKTKYLDLQSHVYLRKWAFDLLGQFYRGYHLYPKGYASPASNEYYLRPDMRVGMAGIAGYRVFNHKRFSYRAAMVQNEWQKKSAGSLLVGGHVYYGSQKADSAFVPAVLNDEFNQKGVTRIRFFEVGPGAGYAYTLVISKHFFITASLAINAQFSFSSELRDNKTQSHFSMVPGYIGRSAIGYNSDLWNLNVSFVANRVITKGAFSRDNYNYTASNIRLTLARHFVPSHKMRKKLNKVDRLFEKKVPIPIDAMKPEKPE